MQPYEQRCVWYTLVLMCVSFDHVFSHFIVPGALNDVNSNRIGYVASNDDVEGMWKETCLKAQPQNLSGNSD